MLVKAIAESTGRATTKIKDDLRKEGDLGKVAMVRICIVHLIPGRVADPSELKKYPTDNVQAETSHSPLRLSESDRNR